ncbi:uncharacterized protein LOC133191699 [Saccostrea echinata]|uniref:uncharacterized protein LOC133191699 n=1 Tax=Saccostrea echinata TaxID=191078 RepID=UPI002A81FEFD|nr:uncharacterized protein LOC133191699 [Saccostrea echinata]XP_061183419.1 uncharacterized protein LOC133191699 [Saccostrea echinata]
MEEQSCLVCGLDFELFERKPHFLLCCAKSICSQCLLKILENEEINQRCPNCRADMPKALDDFILNEGIIEILKFEQFGEVNCEQCKEGNDQIAVKMCKECGLICRKCLSCHDRMKIFSSHELSPIPLNNWSNNLSMAFRAPLFCEKHKQKPESFCRLCGVAVCPECLEISHMDCGNMIFPIDHEFKTVLQSLKDDLHKIDFSKIKSCQKLKETQECQLMDTDREIEALKEQCLNTLEKNFDAVRTGFRGKKQRFEKSSSDIMKQLEKLKNYHTDLFNFLERASSLQNKVGFLQLGKKVRDGTERLRKKLKEVDTVEEIDYLSLTKDIFRELQLAVGEDSSVDFALDVAENDNTYPSILNILRQYRRSKRGKEEGLQTMEVFSGHPVYRVKFKPDNFPRFEYHFELVQKLIDHEESVDSEVMTPDLSEALRATILVAGRVTTDNLKLLKPLTADENEFPSSQGLGHAILIYFIGFQGAENRSRSLAEEKIIKSSKWCVFVTSESESHEDYSRLKEDGRFSVVFHEADAILDNLTSALELSLIDYLKEEKKFPHRKLNSLFLADSDAIITRMQKCSSFPGIKAGQKSREIPREINIILERFKKHIVKYGFHFEDFRVIVDDSYESDIKNAFETVTSTDFCKIVVISKQNLKEQVIPFARYQAQGTKLYQSLLEDNYGTLGCLAILNQERVVALSCRHVCIENSTVYIEHESNERIPVGRCLQNRKGEIQTIQSDLAIVGVNKEVENAFSSKGLLNHKGKPTKAEVSPEEDSLKFIDDIVHKLGASSQWTQGRIVSSEIIGNVDGIIAVKGMNDEEFGEPGDSGSIVFRESFNTRDRKLEVIAVLTAGRYEARSDSDEEKQEEKQNKHDSKLNLVVCSVFKNAFDILKKNDPSLESISFFND